jgi:ribonuclease VapC
MVIDSSALVAILFNEPERKRFVELIGAVDTRFISVATLLETSIVVVSRKGPSGARELDLFLDRAEIQTVAVTREHVEVARTAYFRFGKGYHPARLNFEDCFSYAAAKVSGKPLLFKGNEFSQTDIQLVEV